MGARLKIDKDYRLLVKAVCALVINLLFAFYNGISGILAQSLIFIVSALYYLLLGLIRLYLVLAKQRRQEASAVTGIFLIILSLLLGTMVYVSLQFQTASPHGEILMITIATYTFTKLAAAVHTAVKHRGNLSPFLRGINAVRYCEAAISLLTMQQSMLVSFGQMEPGKALALNIFTGTGVWIFILTLGIFTLKRRSSK